jgi:hypothetical protein
MIPPSTSGSNVLSSVPLNFTVQYLNTLERGAVVIAVVLPTVYSFEAVSVSARP